MAKNSYAIFGLGSFGSKIAIELSKAGHNVLACDVNPARVEELKDKVTQAVIADASNQETIKELNVSKFDAVILSMSSYFEKQILALTFLKQENVRKVLAKANNTVQEHILYRLGADEVIQPEQDVAYRLSRRLSLSNIADMFDFKGSSIAEVKVPRHLAGKNLKELDLRGKHQITVLLLRKEGSDTEEQTGPATLLAPGDHLTVFGNSQSIIELFQEK